MKLFINHAKLATLMLAFMSVSTALLAQGPPGGPGGGGGGGGTPIDGGISLLVAGAAAYGAKKIRDRKKANAEKSI